MIFGLFCSSADYLAGLHIKKLLFASTSFVFHSTGYDALILDFDEQQNSPSTFLFWTYYMRDILVS